MKTKKVYEKPAILLTQKIEARAVTCIAADAACQQNGGPVTS